MKRLLLALALVVCGATSALAAAEVGKSAPDFAATDVHGTPFKLSEQKGKIVVLEWNNPECPFVHKHYDSGNMQRIQAEETAKGVEWVIINSSGLGREGHVGAAEAISLMTDAKGAPSTEILDDDGSIGKMYGASATPHMFVIGKTGILAYAGAIDDQPSPDPKTITGAKNYVTAAIDDLTAGRPVATPVSQAYGCAVKYAK